jgi:phosphoribosylglycinamide formyltransferase 2
MTTLGTPFSSSATRVLLLGAGELGKELTIELKRLGCEVIACDRYENAPAMQVADHCHTFSMLDAGALRSVIELEKPDLIVPEIEAIATAELLALEQQGFKVVPSANAAHLTMNREGIRTLAAETLALPTSEYRFAGNFEEFETAIKEIGYPCFVKPIMSSSGKGQSRLTSSTQIEQAWKSAQEGGRAGKGRVIVEAQIDFDYEITLLTVQHKHGISYCQPIGHRQQDGDYQESWQPQGMSEEALLAAQQIAKQITTALTGWGIFGVELFIKGDKVIFSEVSPRPHDTGMVTLTSQTQSQFALHARAILGLPIPTITQLGPSASAVLLVQGQTNNIQFSHLDVALDIPNTDLRLFGKPNINGKRRMGIGLARAESTDSARQLAQSVVGSIKVIIND